MQVLSLEQNGAVDGASRGPALVAGPARTAHADLGAGNTLAVLIGVAGATHPRVRAGHRRARQRRLAREPDRRAAAPLLQSGRAACHRWGRRRWRPARPRRVGLIVGISFGTCCSLQEKPARHGRGLSSHQPLDPFGARREQRQQAQAQRQWQARDHPVGRVHASAHASNGVPRYIIAAGYWPDSSAAPRPARAQIDGRLKARAKIPTGLKKPGFAPWLRGPGRDVGVTRPGRAGARNASASGKAWAGLRIKP